MAAWITVPTPASAAGFDANGAEQQMFNLINQDRAANGKPALVFNAALGNIARGGNISVCPGETVHGRSQDMIERNYFSHSIPSCGQAVWPAITAAGVQYSSAGENIAWNNYSPQATSVDQANTQFMNSAGHRANILGDFNQVGVGAWMAPGSWTGAGNPISGVMMYTEIFVNGPITQPPPPAGVPGVRANKTVHMAPPLAASVAGPHTAQPATAQGTPGAVPASTTSTTDANLVVEETWHLRPPYWESPESWPGFV
jgi:uncharacterized protein YkwD